MFLIQKAEGRARDILTSHTEELHRLAQALIEYETLSQQEIIDVIQGKPIRR